MARRFLRLVVAPAVLGALGCQVDPIAIVECRTTADCDDGRICSPEHACVVPEDGMSVPPPHHTGDLLTWDATGTVPDGANEYGITGSWFLDDDCSSVLPELASGSFECPLDSPTKSCCTERDELYTGPPPLHEPGWTVTAGVEGESSGSTCARLTTAAHEIDSQWGARLALELNAGDAFDATRELSGGRIVGFSFDIESGSRDSADLQVGIGTTDVDSTFELVTVPSREAKVFLAQLADPSTDPPSPLDLTSITRLDFAMPSTERAAVYDFCIKNVHVLQASNDVPGSSVPGNGGTTSSP